MYNNNDKIRFTATINLDQYPERYWELVFEKSEQLEEMYNKDLYNFTKKEIIGFYKYLDSKSLDYLMVMNLNLIKYAQWALQETLIVDGQNHFAEITNNELSECVNKFGINESIITKERLSELLNKIHAAKEKFIIIALFEGIKGVKYQEIVHANIKDINITKNTMKLCTGRTVEVSNDLIRIAKEADAEVEYISPKGKKYTLYGEPGGLCKYVRQDISEENRGDVVGKTIRNVLDTIGASKYITINSIFTSGLIHKINQFAERDGSSAEEVLSNPDHIKYLENQYGWNYMIKKRFILKYKDFLL